MPDPHHRQDSGGSIEILLVEDNPGDIRLTREAFKVADSETTLRPFTSGEDAIDFLTQEADDDSLSPPDLVLLDLNLPGMGGCEVLETIRANPHLRHLPVLMLTSSGASEDIERCYDASANAYLTKPNTHAEFQSLVETLEQFWFEYVQLPPIPR